jgi:pyridoxamine 5'-phosphate oxidase
MSLDARGLHPDPLVQVQRWYEQARAEGIELPEAMTLATAAPDGRPSARTVLLKGIDPRGFLFFTNYESRKGRELEANPRAALLFYWDPLRRQVRVEGEVERLGAAESDAYFHTRPLGARLSAWVSRQSEVVESRDALEHAVEELRAEAGEELAAPPYWGGYLLRPSAFVFWQHREDRLHDRLHYRRSGEGWLRERLAP